MTLFVVAGEKSGDTIAANYLRNLSKKIEIQGVVGPSLKEIGATELFSIDSFNVMGLTSILKALPRLISLFLKIRKAILEKNPKTVLLVDNAEFSLLLGKSLRKKGFKGKIIQLVSPSVWAWRRGRIKTLEENFDLLLSIFPFEKNYFKDSPLPVEYIGHPIVDELSNYSPTKKLSFPSNKPIIAIFPGSRRKETSLNLPLQLAAVKELTTHQIAISIASNSLIPLITDILKKSNTPATLILPEDRFELMQKAQFAISKLGTINLELAFFGVPTITSFPLPKIEQFLLQHIFKVFLPHYSIVNLIAGRRIFPEYIASFATLQNLKQEAHTLATSPEHRAFITEGCLLINKILQRPCSPTNILNLLLDI
jgi:lipid-A-disaccharide synthase